MNIYTRRSRFGGINIVPMLDILTILLIFFIVHTEFRHQAQVLRLDLPQTDSLAGERADTDDVLLELGDDGELALGGKRIAPEQLADALRQLKQEHPDAKLQVAAAATASMERFINVLDRLNEAGLRIEEVPVRINPATAGH